MPQERITLFMNLDKACALLSALQVALPQVKEEIYSSSYSPETIELYGHLNSIYDDILYQVIKSRKE